MHLGDIIDAEVIGQKHRQPHDGAGASGALRGREEVLFLLAQGYYRLGADAGFRTTADALLANNAAARYAPAHPIAGRDRPGLTAAEANLSDSNPVVLTTHAGNTPATWNSG